MPLFHDLTRKTVQPLRKNRCDGKKIIPVQMSQRNEILGRIKEALRSEAHRPKHAGTSGDGARTGATPREWLPLVTNDLEGMAEAFARNCVELRT